LKPWFTSTVRTANAISKPSRIEFTDFAAIVGSMHRQSLFIPWIITSSFFLVHCSSDDDSAKGNSGTSGSGATSGGSVSKGGSTFGSAGTPGGAGKSGSAGTAGSAATSGGSGQGGSGGAAAGQSGRGGASMAGGASGGSSGGAGMAAGGKGSAGMSGMGGSVGSGVSGMGGAVGAGSGGMGAAGTGGGGGFMLTSSVITEGGMFPDTNTCAGADTSPDLTWTAGPSGTLSYAMILFDTQNSLNHWVMWDIPSSVTTLPAMLDTAAMPAMPAGAQQKAIQGNGYYGPCPNGMDHLYKFTVYALPVASLSGAMTSSQTSALAMAVMNANPLASASLSAHSSASMN
jgi:Raf kinase inhibitor-like YbhB/YbcL family protein